MKVIALSVHDGLNLADTQIYRHKNDVDDYENAFLISNQTAFTILYLDYSVNVVRILNKSGIAAIVCEDEDELKLYLNSNYSYDFDNDIVYLHDYSYYSNNEIRTDQYWLSQSDINNYLPNGWKCTFVGYLGELTRGHYNYSRIIQNTATDDDIIMQYIYSTEIDFTHFVIDKIKNRITSALPFDRLSSRVFRHKVYDGVNECINVGPRNESMFTLLNKPRVKNFPANKNVVKDIVNKIQSKFAERHISQFDIGQYKNMCNVMTSIYHFYFLFSRKPKVYMIGSAPSHWLYDVKYHTDIKFETWDPLPTPLSDNHHNDLFTINDVHKLLDESILYIDIRTDRGTVTWQEWRKRVERETITNLEIAYKYLYGSKKKVVCVKMTAMDIELPLQSILLHFPTSYIRSEFYVILDSTMNLDYKKFIPSGTFYAHINSHIDENVFIGPVFKLLNNSTSKRIIALYSLQNVMNDKNAVISWIIKLTSNSLITLRLNNSFDNRTVEAFKDTADYLTLPTELKNISRGLISSYKGVAGIYGLSTSNDIKANGNNQLFIITRYKNYNDVDEYANHMSISRRSHSIRFSESATTLSGYLFRNLSNNVTNLHHANEDNYVSGHFYNALIYYRYNYTFDVIRWLKLHKSDQLKIKGGKFYRHSFIELNTAIQSSFDFAIIQNDDTLKQYTLQMREFLYDLYAPRFADNPNAYIGLKFSNFIYDKAAHLSMGFFDLNETDVEVLHKLWSQVLKIFKNCVPLTKYTYKLGANIVAAVSNVQNEYNQLYNLFYDNNIIFGQSRIFIPHITIENSEYKKQFRFDEIRLEINEIYIKRLDDKSVLLRSS